MGRVIVSGKTGQRKAPFGWDAGEMLQQWFSEHKTFELNKPLQANMLLSVPVKDVEDGFESGTIKTNCADIIVDFTYSDVT